MGATESTATGPKRQSETKDLVNKIFEKIEINPNLIKGSYRFEPKPTNSKYPSIIKITLTNSSDRFCILKNAKKLRNDNSYGNILINPDLTPAQRNTQKILLAKKKVENQKLASSNSDKIYVIRNEQLEMVTKQSKTPIVPQTQPQHTDELNDQDMNPV